MLFWYFAPTDISYGYVAFIAYSIFNCIRQCFIFQILFLYIDYTGISDGYLTFVPYGIFGPQFVPLFLYSFLRKAVHLSNIVCLYLVACAVM